MKNSAPSCYDVIRFPLITEKGSAFLQPQNKYLFAVATKATKPEIRKAVEKLFRVKVVSVSTMNCRGKVKRLRGRKGQAPDWKKAVVTLKEGDKIEFA